MKLYGESSLCGFKSCLAYNAVYFVKAIILSSHHAVIELETLLGGVRVCVGICFPSVSEVSNTHQKKSLQ